MADYRHPSRMRAEHRDDEKLVQCDELGNLTGPNNALFFYAAPVSVRHTGNVGLNTTIWSMRNNPASSKDVYIKSINLATAFDAAASTGLLSYSLHRFAAATPGGGTITTVIEMDQANETTNVADVRFSATGLTVTFVVFEEPFVIIPTARNKGSVTSYVRNTIGLKLYPGDGLCIRTYTSVVSGLSISGEIAWFEK